MKRTIASVILMALTVLSVASVMMQPVKADIIVFTAQLLASNEVPPITNADRNAFGTATVTLDTVANTARFDFSVENLAAPAVILAHIHEGAAGVVGPVRVDSGISPASPLTVVNGSVSFSRSGLTVPADVKDRLVANPSAFYFNVHSTLNPGGVVRGQLVRAAAINPGTSAPTLSEWGIILMTLLFVAAGTFFLVGRGRAATASGAAGASVMLSGPAKAIDWKLLAQVALCVEAVIALGLLALAAGAVDVMGALTSGPVVAFILHLFIGSARRR